MAAQDDNSTAAVTDELATLEVKDVVSDDKLQGKKPIVISWWHKTEASSVPSLVDKELHDQGVSQGSFASNAFRLVVEDWETDVALEFINRAGKDLVKIPQLTIEFHFSDASKHQLQEAAKDHDEDVEAWRRDSDWEDVVAEMDSIKKKWFELLLACEEAKRPMHSIVIETLRLNEGPWEDEDDMIHEEMLKEFHQMVEDHLEKVAGRHPLYAHPLDCKIMVPSPWFRKESHPCLLRPEPQQMPEEQK